MPTYAPSIAQQQAIFEVLKAARAVIDAAETGHPDRQATVPEARIARLAHTLRDAELAWRHPTPSAQTP